MTLKVTQGHPNCLHSKGHIYHFLLVVCSNMHSIWHRFWDITTFTVYVTGKGQSVQKIEWKQTDWHDQSQPYAVDNNNNNNWAYNDKRFAVAQFLRDSILLRDTVGKNSGCYTFTRNEISCIVNYLATVQLFVFLVLRVRIDNK